MDHLGAEAHNQQQRFRAGVAEDFVANVDAIGVGDLRRLMGKRHVGVPLDQSCDGTLYGMVYRIAEGFRVSLLTQSSG
jgi:hypothetical protein